MTETLHHLIGQYGYLAVAIGCFFEGETSIPPAPPRATRIGRIDSAALARLEELAALTYAPATEDSRRRGAGAGLTDND